MHGHTQLEVRIEQLEEKLSDKDGASTEIEEDAMPKETDMDASWMEFEFDSSRSKEVTNSKSTSVSVAADFAASGGAWRVSGYSLVSTPYHPVTIPYHLVSIPYHPVTIPYHLVSIPYHPVTIPYPLVSICYLAYHIQ